MKALSFRTLILLVSIIALQTRGVFAFDFEFKYRNVLSADALKYVVEQTNMTRTNEGRISYWNPANNGTEARLTQRFSMQEEIADAFLKIDYIYINNYGGSGYGSGSLWASKNGTDWVQILDAPTPNDIAAGYGYSDYLPQSVTGGKELWIQARLRTESFRIAAQFLRFDENRTNNCFELQINFREPAPILTTLTPQNGSITGGGSYPLGSSATLSAQPNSGYVFTRWTGDASGSVNPCLGSA